MDLPSKYFHDRLVLLLVSVNAFLALATTVIILFRLDTSNSNGYFIQYRANLGLDAYTVGSFTALLSFILFALFVFAFHTFVSIRIYNLRRNLAITVLAFGTLLLGLTVIVSNALLVLR